MLPTLSARIPAGPDWVCEVKYDGFRVILYIEKGSAVLMSRNGKNMNALFPEIIEWLMQQTEDLSPYLPLILDGEAVSLANDSAADFQEIQIRGRMRSADRILQAADRKPCRLLIFDLLSENGQSLQNEPYLERKSRLAALFKNFGWPLAPSERESALIQMISFHEQAEQLWNRIELYGGEGLIAKHKKGRWEAGKRTELWKKIKNYRKAILFIISYDEKNGYFGTGLFKDGAVFSPGSFSHGLSSADRDALIKIIKEHAVAVKDQVYRIDPAICVKVTFLSYVNEMREPSFDSFQFNADPSLCTWERFQFDAAPLHRDVQITHPDKPVWNRPSVNKLQYIHFLLKISPHFLPLLKDRPLTLIRYPHGSGEERFYQKNVPDYAPSFIQSAKAEGIDYMLCSTLSDLIWLGNQLALEFHLPFQKINQDKPMEIVFDLDPPSREEFSLAIRAAREIHSVLQPFGIRTFPKLSGGKGIQIHIPLTGTSLTFDETRKFTSFIAHYLTGKFPDLFTVERFKKNRKQRLYLDYLQHGEGKTIIAPYSPRGSEGACVASPLLWDEITEELSPDQYNVNTVFSFISKRGCPFQRYFISPQDEAVSEVLQFIRNHA
ncbi:DNA ligase D [Metabacillus mangrovi]|nr:DNA ligase D [Metabacillus mangrovi]